MELSEVRDWIRTASRDDLNNVVDLVRLRRVQLSAEVGMSFSLGEMVQFDTKNKGTIVGKFMGIKRKNATVITETGSQWAVSPELLSKAT